VTAHRRHSRALRERLPEVPILALTVYDSDDQVFRALRAGASGYLLKNTPPARLLDSLREVAAGSAPMSPEVARRVLRLFRDFAPPVQASYRLSNAEQTSCKKPAALLIGGASPLSAPQGR
jgi:DNA-binding NarL/FixJ family response regulator